MSLTLVPYTDDQAGVWDAFVRDSRNGTLFHTQRLLGYHPSGRFEDHSFLFRDGSAIRAMLPGAFRREEGKVRFISHPGSTLGGMVLAPREGVATTMACLDLLLEHLRSEGVSVATFFRLTSSLARRAPSDDQEYALLQHGFRLFRYELGSMISLDGVREEDILGLFDVQCRNQVRQAERAGVVVRQSEDFDAYWPILEQTLDARHGVRPTHTIPEMRRIVERCPGEIRFYGAELQGRLIAGLMTMSLTEHCEYVKYMAQDYGHQKARPMNLLIVAALKDCLRRGVGVLDLGVSMDASGEKIHPGLFAFKEGFGAHGVRRESFTIDL